MRISFLLSVMIVFIFSGCVSVQRMGTDLAYAKEHVEDVNKGAGEWTPLHSAANDGNLEIVKYLILNGANVNAKERRGLSVLYWSMRGDNFEVVKYLFANGVDINSDEVLWPASGLNKPKILKYIINKRDNPSLSAVKEHLVMDMAMRNNIEMVKFLVSHGANINLRNFLGESALTVAKSLNFTDIVDFLKLAANPNYKDYQKAKQVNSLKSYQSFIRKFPRSTLVKKAKRAFQQLVKTDPSIQVNTIKEIKKYLKSKKVDAFIAYVKNNREVSIVLESLPKVNLLFVGPEELPVIKILDHKNKGISETILVSKIKALGKGYKNFSLDEIASLNKHGLTDKLLAAMLDATTAFKDKQERRAEQQAMIAKQEAIAQGMQESQAAALVAQQRAAASARNNQSSGGNGIGNAIMNKVADKAMDSLLDSLF